MQINSSEAGLLIAFSFFCPTLSPGFLTPEGKHPVRLGSESSEACKKIPITIRLVAGYQQYLADQVRSLAYKRILNLSKSLRNKSFFLFGPRSTGKSYLIQETLGASSQIIDLLDGRTHLRLIENPSLLNEMLASIPTDHLVVIDEVQKNPSLLDQVHQMIEKEF